MIIRYRNFQFQKPFLPSEGTFYALKRQLLTDPNYKYFKFNFKEDHKAFTYVSYVALALMVLVLIVAGIDSAAFIVVVYVGLFFAFFWGEILSWNVMKLEANSFNKNLAKIIYESYDYKDFAAKYRNI